MFPWHSTVVAPSRPAERWDPAAPRPANPSPQDASVSSSERIFQQAYRAMVDAGIDLEREATGRLKNPAPMLRAVEREGVKFGPQGAGMLIALADRVPVRPPTKEEFMRCCLQEGTVITGPMAAPSAPVGRGRGLAHVFNQSHAGAPGAKGRGGGVPAGRGRGAALSASSQRGNMRTGSVRPGVPPGAGRGGAGASSRRP